MSTTCPAPFPTEGQRPSTHARAMERMQALSYQLPAKLTGECDTRLQVSHFFCKHTNIVGWATRALWLLGLSCLLALSGCDLKPPTWAVSYGAVNHTDKYIVAIAINGEGGILPAPPYGAGNAGVCCVVVPQQWRPGLTVKVQWEEEGDWKRDEKGNPIYEDGRKIYVPLPWKTQVVPLPKYEKSGDFYVFFFPGDVVKVALTSSPEWKEWDAPTEEDLKHDNRVKRNYGSNP